MAKFIKCSCEHTQYRSSEILNSPVNIELVTQVEKTIVRYYPDNEGTPAIKFHGIDKEWIYAKFQGKQRDLDYESIVSNQF